MSRRIYKNAAAKQRAFRENQKAVRARAIKLWVAPADQIKRLAREVDWLKKLLRDVQVAQETRRLAEIGQRLEQSQKTILAKNDALADRVAEFERLERRRTRNRNRKRQRREGGIIVSSDPQAIREHYQQDRPSAFAPTSPRIATPAPKVAPAVPRPAPAAPWWVEAKIQITSPIPSPAPAPAGDKSAALLAKIKAAGYGSAIRGDKILYGGTDLLTPEEWARRMPGILD